MRHVMRVGVVLVAAIVLAGCGQREEATPRPQSPEGQWLGIFPLFLVFMWRARWNTRLSVVR